jgi:8-oxo-dGTP pyrophosphatase MutT (NUDIX family)
MPIVSYGVIVCRINPMKNNPEYLMICRRKTLGYIDLMRGKYSTTNKFYILNMLKQMTREEKSGLISRTFDDLWKNLWSNKEDDETTEIETIEMMESSSSGSAQYRHEEINSKLKFNSLKKGIHFNGDFYTMESLIKESSENGGWDDQEWGFPKGRRNYQENEYDCALREFAEETGYSEKELKMVVNLFPFEEIFMGSNYKSYKHKYYLTFMNYTDSLNHSFTQNMEVSKVEWFSLEECLNKIRCYNDEKKRIIMKVNSCIEKYLL